MATRRRRRIDRLGDDARGSACVPASLSTGLGRCGPSWQPQHRHAASNALASSIVLVCRPRSTDAGITTRKDFVASLKRELPEALRTLQHGNIAPVDLAQAAIGPGMAVFCRYAKVLEPDGSAMHGPDRARARSTRSSTRSSQSRRASSTRTRAGRSPGSSSSASRRRPTGPRRRSRRRRTRSVAGLVEAGIVGGRARPGPAPCARRVQRRLGPGDGPSAPRLGGDPAARPRPADGRRGGGRRPPRTPRWPRRHRPRPRVPAVPRCRAQGLDRGGARVQRARRRLDGPLPWRRVGPRRPAGAGEPRTRVGDARWR